MSKIIELNIKGNIVKTKPLRDMSMSDIRKLHDMEMSGEYGDMIKAMKTIEFCLVHPSDMGRVSELSVDEFTELITEWIEMQQPDATTL